MADVLLDQINALITLWTPRLGLSEWLIDVKLQEGLEDAAQTNYGQAQYHRAFMVFNPKTDDYFRDLEYTVLHELCHVVLAPYVHLIDTLIAGLTKDAVLARFGADVLEDGGEAVVEQLTRAFLRAYTKEAAQ